MPTHGEKTDCKNCGHRIYYQNDHWEHHSRVYKSHGFPYTTEVCYAPGDEAWGPRINAEGMRKTRCGCRNPEPYVCPDCGESLGYYPDEDEPNAHWLCDDKDCGHYQIPVEIVDFPQDESVDNGGVRSK